MFFLNFLRFLMMCKAISLMAGFKKKKIKLIIQWRATSAVGVY